MFKELFMESSIKPMYDEIMKKISKKYKDQKPKFENSMGSLLVKNNEGITIGLINRRNIDKWEMIIDKNLKSLKNLSKEKSIVKEPKILPKGYKPAD